MTEVPSLPDIEAYTFYQQEWKNYEDLYDAFEHQVPEKFNIATYACSRWANDKGRVALFGDTSDGESQTYTYWQLENITNRLSNYFQKRGIEPGDRIGINMPQKPETAIAHLAAWKIGAVSIPLSSLFGSEALEYRLNDSGAKAVIVDEMNIDALRSIKDDLNALETILTVGNLEREADEEDFWASQEGTSREFDNVETAAEDHAIILYTSGTTGPPKGVLHAHRSLLGHLTGFVDGYCNLEIRDSDVLWTPAEWAWIASVLGTMASTLYHGLPLVAYYSPGPFDPIEAFDVLESYGVTATFMPPTALRMMMQRTKRAREHDLSEVRSIYSGGESLGEDVVEWAEDVFGDAVVHEVYGQTEANMVLEESTKLFDRREGSLGKPIPGREVSLLDRDTGKPTVSVGEVGEIGVRCEGDPICFKEYWNKPDKTANTLQDGWVRTGDLAKRDEDGYFYFVSRKDDVIISAGYRIGPDEVEDTVASHPAVVNAGVIGVPDDKRGQIPKAFIVLTEEYQPTDDLKSELQSYVKDRLAKYEYPRKIEFIEELPQTVTGKVKRTALREREGID